MSRLSELTATWPLLARRILWWPVVEILGGVVTGSVLGAILGIFLVVTESGALALVVLGVVVGAALGAIIGAIAGFVAILAATAMSRHDPLEDGASSAVGAIAALVGSVVVLAYLSWGDDDVAWYLFAIGAAATAGWVGWRIGPRAEARVRRP